MAKKKRQRISYVLPLASSSGGHRLGINGLAVDEDQSILYSGGRDGVICAWNLNLDLKHSHSLNPFLSTEDPPSDANGQPNPITTFRRQVQAHTHWVNDILLTQNNSTLVSASSDVTVKVWRPHSLEGGPAKTIGVHSDYVKCLATPDTNSSWVASGGLDHKICLWDLHGGGQRLEIDVGKVGGVSKGSIYALSAKGPILASGGPESVVRVWDPRTGKSITKLVGHTDNIRDILISDDGDMLLTASSDQTVKVWSLTAGRCMHTLTMHNDSVWALYSSHPQLSVFYSSDRSGLVAKTDTRQAVEIDEGISVAVCQEHDGVAKVVAAGNHLWTASSSSSINRWSDVDTQLEIETPPPSPPQSRATSSLSKSAPRSPSLSMSHLRGTKPITNGTSPARTIPYNAVLPLSITAPFRNARGRDFESFSAPSGPSMRKASEAILDNDLRIVVPVQSFPEDTVEGQNGLIKHVMLNDRKRVLTLDTAGEVVLWDLLKCKPIKSFGNRPLDDVFPEVNTTESVANWCAVDTRTGKLSVMLEENYCFDAEVYADEIDIPEKMEFREDQRINLGKWILRNLFASFIDEEIMRDDVYRRSLRVNGTVSNGFHRPNAPLSISIPGAGVQYSTDASMGEPLVTPRPASGANMVPVTPGFAIGIATPSRPPSRHNPPGSNHLAPTAEEDRDSSKSGQPPGAADKSSDYFSANQNSQASETSSESNSKVPETPGEGPPGSAPLSPIDDKEEKKRGSSLFGKKFQMTFPKKLGRNSVEAKPAPAAEEKPEGLSDRFSEREEKGFEENLFGVIQRIRREYDEQLDMNTDQTPSIGITPSLPSETPVLRIPPHTLIIIQEDNPESGGLADLYRGAITTLARDADIVEKVAPMWLGELLLRNQIPLKENVKVSFVLQPYQDMLPSIASPDGNARLNANRMLRVKKILTYIAERIEPASEHPDPYALKPEEYLELYCHDQLVHPNMTLSTLRVHIWRTGGDVLLYYKANGRKPIKHATTGIPDGPGDHTSALPTAAAE